MEIGTKTIVLRDGRECTLCSVGEDKAVAVMDYLVQVLSESNNLTSYADEFDMSVEEERKFLSDINKSPISAQLGVFIEGELIGLATVRPVSERDKLRHRASFGLSVKKAYWHSGVASALMSALIDTARSAGYEQLELEVVASNDRAIALYERFGFAVYGTRPRGFRYRDGSYDNEHLMALAL